MYIGQAQLLFYAYVYFLWCIVNVAVATERGRSNALVFFLSLFATPLIIYLYLIATPIVIKESPSEAVENPSAIRLDEQAKTAQRRNPLTQR